MTPSLRAAIVCLVALSAAFLSLVAYSRRPSSSAPGPMTDEQVGRAVVHCHDLGLRPFTLTRPTGDVERIICRP